MRGGSQTSLIWKCRHIYTNACFNQIRKRKKKSQWSDLVRFPWFLKRDPLSYFLFVVFFFGQSGLLEPCTDSLLQNPAKNVANHAVAHALFLLLQVYRSEGGQTTVLLIDSSAQFGGGSKGSLQRQQVSQEAIWALPKSSVSRLLNPVSTSTKQEEAQPPTADISDSLYNATR